MGETEGDDRGLFDFNVSKDILDQLKASKKRGPSKKIGDDSLQSGF